MTSCCKPCDTQPRTALSIIPVSPGSSGHFFKVIIMNDKDIESEIQAKGLTAPRVTRDDMIANIAHTEIVKHVSVTGQVLRWAIITTKNGFAVTGKPSCAVSSENDDDAIGKQIALTNAEDELWPLMGYALKEKLSQQ